MTIHTATLDTDRKPSRFLNYRGDRRGAVGQVVGPTALNDYATIVSVDYDDEADTSRAGIAFGILEGSHFPPHLQPRHPVYGLPTAVQP